MPIPNPELLQRLEHLSEADRLAWLDRWSRALMHGDTLPPLPPLPSRDNNQ